jgi:uncharacterized protein
MTTKDDVFLQTRDPYREEDYFSLNVRNGVVRNPAGTRMVFVPEDMLMGLHQGLEDETGAASPIILYGCGKWWGKQWARRHHAELRQLFGADASDLSLGLYELALGRVWALHGWGALSLGFDLRQQGMIEVTVASSPYADVVGSLGRTSDHLLAGVLAALLTELAGRPLECVEISCKSKGDAVCVFLVGMKARVDTVAEWVRAGQSRAQIRETILHDELV